MRYKNYLLMFIGVLIASVTFAQVTVKGTVTSKSDGQPLPGVTVVIKNTQRGTVTDLDGKFEIQVDSLGQELQFSFIGMETVTMPASSQPMSISMSEGVNLQEVVVTALGVEKEKKSLGYAVTEVDGGEIQSSGEANMIEGLAGKVAGVQVNATSGTPGASSKILIRGTSSFTGENQPLIVIDGVPIDNSTITSVAGDYPYNATLSGVQSSNRAIDINPEDIESVSVLKGPAAAALYGVQGANGVIIYTTKKGKGAAGDRGLKVDYSFRYSATQVNKLPEKQYTYAQGVGGGQYDSVSGTYNDSAIYLTYDGTNGFGAGSWGTSSSWGPPIGKAGTQGEDLTAYPNVVDDYFETGNGFTNDISFSGASEKASFRASFSDYRETGVVPNSSFKRNTIRLNADYKFNERLSMGGSFNYTYSRAVRVQNGSNLSGVMLSLMRNPASFDPAGGPGEGGYKYKDGAPYNYFLFYDNPYWTAYENPFTDYVNRFIVNMHAKVKVTDWFDITDRVGTDIYSDIRKQIFSVYSWDPLFAPDGQVDEDRIRKRWFYNDLMFNFYGNLTKNGDLSGSLTLGFNSQYITFDDLYARGGGLSIPDFYNLSNASDLYASQFTSERSSWALFFNGELQYKSFLFLTVTGRNEWHSTFGPAKNNFFYPSVALSWVFTEHFDADWFDFGKLRVNYAAAGNAPGPYLTKTYYTNKNFTDGFTNGISFPYLGLNGFGYSSTVGNTNLKPERTSGFEVGLDLKFFRNRLFADLNYYNQTSSDLLIFQPIAASSGFNQVFTNAGKMRNSGFEVLLGGRPFDTEGGFVWEITLNWSRNRNEVLELAPGVDELNIEAAFSSITSMAIVGKPNGALYGVAWQRDDNGNLIINKSTGLPYQTTTAQNIGDPWPDWLAGLRNTFSYKGFSLSVFFDYRKGGDLWNGTHARMNRLGVSKDSEAREQSYIIEGVYAAEDQFGNVIFDDEGNVQGSTEKNTTKVDPIVYFQQYEGDAGAPEQAIEDGTWFRMREITLSYRYNFASDSRFFRYIEAYATGRNLWLSTDYSGVDPETSLTGAGSNIQGFDYFNNPGTKSYIFGVKLGF